MRLTPLDIREQQFRRVMRGLDPEEVEGFLASVASEFEGLVAGNNELRQRVLELEEKITEYKTMEKALRDALLAAERVMGEAKESAQREAGLIVREAEMSAERAKGRLSQDLVQIQHEISELRRLKDTYLTRVRWLLRSHLEMIDGHAQEFSEIDASFAPTAFGPTERSTARPQPDSGGFAAPDLGPRFDPGVESSPVSHPLPETRPGESAYTSAPFADWNTPSGPPPFGGTPSVDLDDVLRPVGPDGTYEPGPSVPPPPPAPGRASTSEEIAQAARRAERLAAEARAALERHGSRPAPGADPDWGIERGGDDPGRR